MRALNLLIPILVIASLAANAKEASDEALATLSREIGERIIRVPEFKLIREEAKKMGVRAYLFGGSAASYSHYVRQDLAREAGSNIYPQHFYDYDYANIFRSNQDLDLVIDGSAEQAQMLEKILKEKFPYFLGEKAIGWEVRPLRVSRGEKEAILDNPSFLNQHTDSHSTGLVEVTQSPPKEYPVKDVKDWGAKTPKFLKDVAEQKLNYYFSPLHSTTRRAAKGLNPPILSVIRYLTKAFQYDLEIREEDRKKIQKIVSEFKPEQLDNEYLRQWVEKNGKKLFMHSVDIERSWNELEELGLRRKLIAVKTKTKEELPLSWWLNREPLRSKEIGKGNGRTAAQIAHDLGEKELIVSHETSGYLAYESISRSRAGDLNSFISRSGAKAEKAVFGEGFYTQTGRKGAKGTGFTIRMKLDEAAREGTDFKLTGNYDDYILIKNKAAVKLIQEPANFSFLGYMQALEKRRDTYSDERASFEFFKRKSNRLNLISPEDEAEVVRMVEGYLTNRKPMSPFLIEYFSLPFSRKRPDILRSLIESGVMNLEIARDVLSRNGWQGHPEFVSALIKKKGAIVPGVATYILSQPHWRNHPELVLELIKDGRSNFAIAEHVLSQPHWQDHPELVEALIKNGRGIENQIAKRVLFQSHWQNHPALKAAVGNQSVNLKNLERAFKNGKTFFVTTNQPPPIVTASCSKSYGSLAP